MKNKLIYRNFTLVELLTVIGIIAILAGIIIPVSMNVRARGVKTSCLNNLRQIGLALNMYADDNKGFYPYCTQFPSNPPVGQEGMPGIAETLLPYAKAEKVFLCPADAGEKYFRSEGSSYDWKAEVYNGLKIGRKNVVEESLPALPNIPVMFDYDNFHGNPDSRTAKNYLYPTGNVSGELLDK
ncbi:MAG: DUF1559 domain-containing protein [Victivallales bacterium]|nr:DUF1559 domain-containing protein [Victivallales bacterium]